MVQTYQTTVNEPDDMDKIVMLAAMMEHAREKKRYDTRLIDTFPSLTTVPSPLFLGSFSWTSANEGWRVMKASTSISTSEGWMSPAELARNYIAVKYPKRRRVTTEQYHEVMRHRSQPLLAIPGTYGDCQYIDIKSAYWSILNIVGWDVEYFPNRWLGAKSSVQDYPFEWSKLSRNSLVSVGLAGSGNFWTGEKLVSFKKPNPYINMVLWACVQDILNGIASDMERAGALYINTDGYIFRAKDAGKAFEIAENWGVVVGVKEEGAADIVAAGTYSIGMKPNRRAGVTKPKAYRNIADVNTAWLRPRVYKLAKRCKT